MNCAQVSVLKHVDEIGLYSLMNGVCSVSRKSEIIVESSDLISDSSDERSLLSQSLVLKLLILLDLSDSNSARSVSSAFLLSFLHLAGFGFHSLHLRA